MNYRCLVEHNEHEGEYWHTFLPDDAATAEFISLFDSDCDDDDFYFDDRVFSEVEVSVVCDLSRHFDLGHYLSMFKQLGPIDVATLRAALKNEDLASLLYKRGLANFQAAS